MESMIKNMKKCQWCLDDGSIPCDHCGGVGMIDKTGDCRWCNGKGELGGYPCADCEGTGFIGGLKAKAEFDRIWYETLLKTEQKLKLEDAEFIRQILEDN